MQTRNPTYNADNSIDMEIEHPVYGWIPFTASPDDVEELGRVLHAAALAGELGAVTAYIAPPEPTHEERLAPARASATLTRREFFQQLIVWGLYDTVMAMADDPTVPLTVRVDLKEATSFDRTWPALIQMAHDMGMTDAQLDQFFGIEVPL